MLAALRYPSLDELIDAAVPQQIRSREVMHLSSARSGQQVLEDLRALADRNHTRVQMTGLGYHDTITPAVLRRNMLESPAWYTTYTPYQPEISQDRLEALLTFQQVIEDLTALPPAGASLLDEATAVLEAILLMRRANKAKSEVARVVVHSECLPQTLAVVRVELSGINLRSVDTNHVAITCDECTTDQVMAKVNAALGGREPHALEWQLPTTALRTTAYLQHNAFDAHLSETAMMRLCRRLSDEDLAPDRTMIPLGSCTMKLNSAVEVEPISWPGFADIHPHAPRDQTPGYQTPITGLQTWLSEITGYDDVSLFHNAGSRGELAGPLRQGWLFAVLATATGTLLTANESAEKNEVTA